MGDKSWYARLREAHLCVQCKQADERTLAGRSRCLKCEERFKRYRANSISRADEWRASHRCTKCGAPLGDDPHKRCAKCRSYHRQYMRQYDRGPRPAQKSSPAPTLYELREQRGECVKCGKAPALSGRLVCEACYQHLCEMAARSVAARKRKREETTGRAKDVIGS